MVAAASPTPVVGSGKVSTYESAAQHPMQAIAWGDNQDLDYAAAGGAIATAGPLNGLLVRLAVNVGAGSGVRVAFGPDATTASNNIDPGTLIPGSTIEYVAIDYTSYIAVISNDTTTGALNITVAL